MFKFSIEDTDTVSVFLFPALNNVCPGHLFKRHWYSLSAFISCFEQCLPKVLYIQSQNRIVKTRKIKAKSIENKEIIHGNENNKSNNNTNIRNNNDESENKNWES